MYAIDVARDVYVAERAREVGSDQVAQNKVSTCCYETQVDDSRIMLMLEFGPVEMSPPDLPTLALSDHDAIWCTSAAELEWVALPPAWENANAPDGDGWWICTSSIPIDTITLK